MTPDTTVHPPWYRQPWMWLVVGLPLLSVIASLTMVVIAVKNRDDLVRDDWYRAGRAINQNMQADTLARDMNLAGELVLEPASLQVDITLTQNAPLSSATAAAASTQPASLQLTLVHSTRAHEDMTTILARRQQIGTDKITWHGTLPRLPLGKYHITLEPVSADGANTENARWRLRAGDVIFQGVAVPLLPAG